MAIRIYRYHLIAIYMKRMTYENNELFTLIQHLCVWYRLNFYLHKEINSHLMHACTC
jgi:hypothetical protein